MTLNFIDSLVQGYVVLHLIEHKAQFPDHLKPTLKSFIAAELDELEINHDCPTYEQLENFDFWDNGNANNIYAFNFMSDETDDDVQEILNQYVYELVMQKVTAQMQCVTIDGEVFYIDEDSTELGLDDIEIYPNANAIYVHMYNLIDIEKIKDVYNESFPDTFNWYNLFEKYGYFGLTISDLTNEIYLPYPNKVICLKETYNPETNSVDICFENPINRNVYYVNVSEDGISQFN